MMDRTFFKIVFRAFLSANRPTADKEHQGRVITKSGAPPYIRVERLRHPSVPMVACNLSQSK